MAAALPFVISGISTLSTYIAPMMQVLTAVSALDSMFSSPDTPEMSTISTPMLDADLDADVASKVQDAEVSVDDATKNEAAQVAKQKEEDRRRQLLVNNAFKSNGAGFSQTGGLESTQGGLV